MIQNRMLRTFILGGVVSAMSLNAAQAQLMEVQNTLTPGELLEQVLLGEGVTVTNVTFNGLPADEVNEQIGAFTNGNAAVGMTSGVLLATGNVNVTLGPNDDLGATEGGGNFEATDPDLEILSGLDINDACVLEFDFVAVGDSIKFNFVFASEEYAEWVCGGVNDAFGFFLSGPGITGPFTNNAKNIALIPGGEIPVSINTVNPGVAGINGDAQNCANLDPNWQANSVYYAGTNAFGYPEMQFDGSTVILTARSAVQCGGTYHIKLAIGDGGDAGYDSGVFLESGSFVSTPFIPVLTPGPGIVGQNVILEGCYPVTFNFTQTDEEAATDTVVVYLTAGGTATAGDDYNPAFPDSLVFLPGDTIVSVTLNFPVDGDGEEIVTLQLQSIASCAGVSITNTFTFYIDDQETLVMQGGYQLLGCGTATELVPAIQGGYPPYTVEWSTGVTAPTLAVTTTGTTIYNAIVEDECGETAVAQFVVELAPLAALNMEVTSGPTELSEGCDEAELTIDRPAGLGGALDILLDYTGTAQLGSDHASVTTVQLPDGENSASFTVAPLEDGVDDDNEDLRVTANFTNSCAQSSSALIDLVFRDSPAITVEGEEQLLLPCGEDSVLVSVEAAGGVGGLNVTWSTGATGPVAYLPNSAFGVYTITATDDCGRSAQEFITVELLCDISIPNVFTPNGDGVNNYFHIEGIQYVKNTVKVFNRWGQVVFEAKDYKNSWDGRDVPDGTYFYEITTARRNEPYTGSVMILR
jgi:gliding motility-associated-like protein